MFPGMQVRDGGRVAAAEGSCDGLDGQDVALVGGVQGRAEVLVHLDRIRSAARRPAFGDLHGRCGVALPHGLAQVGALFGHRVSPWLMVPSSLYRCS